jgi:uncharacterized damage-inducible protein DinB
MGNAGIEQSLYMMDLAFEGDPSLGHRNWHSLLVNLDSVSDSDWLWHPEDGRRSVFDIVQHVGACKYVYDNHAFGDGSMRWDRPGSIPWVEPVSSPDEVLQWLKQGQRQLREHLAALDDDAELYTPRLSNWGIKYETRWLINTMIQHDLYHAGEINHLRALHQGNDE